MSALALENTVTTPEELDLAEVDDLFTEVDEALAEAGALGAASGDRHGSLDALCAKLHAIIVGRRAEELLADVDALPEETGVWVSPSWVWLHSRVNVGRKERGANGVRLRLPVRVDWSEGPLHLVPVGAPIVLHWTAAGLGHTGADALTVSAVSYLMDDQVEEQPSGMPTSVAVPVISRMELVAELTRLAAAGHSARWEALEYLEPYITRALTLAQSSVAHEMSQTWGAYQAVVDATKLEAIRDQMLLGDESHPGKVSQLLDRCLKPETFKKVEPLKYIKESLRRDANTEIRRAIGDPHIGAKIRRVARELSTRDVDTIVDEYRERYPKDRLSRDRAVAALSVAPDAMACWWALPSFQDR